VTHALVFPRMIRSEMSPEMKSSSEGPSSMFWLKSLLEDGVARHRVFEGARHRRLERTKLLMAIEYRDISICE
jgi:hypothetical protein